MKSSASEPGLSLKNIGLHTALTKLIVNNTTDITSTETTSVVKLLGYKFKYKHH